MSLLYLFWSACGGGLGLLGFLAPQKAIHLCVADPLDLTILGKLAVRLLSGALLVGSVWAYQQSGGLPEMPDIGALASGKLSHLNTMASEIIAPPDTPRVSYGDAYRQQRSRRYDEEY